MIDKMAPRGIRLKDLVDIVERRSPRGGEIERVAAAVRLSTEIEGLVDHYVQHARRGRLLVVPDRPGAGGHAPGGTSALRRRADEGARPAEETPRCGRGAALGIDRRDEGGPLARPRRGPAPGSRPRRHRAHPPRPARSRRRHGDGPDGARMRVAAVRAEVERVVGRGPGSTAEEIPLTPRAKEVLALSRCEAAGHGKEQIGPEHVLLGLLREDDGLAARIPADAGVPLTRLRKEILAMLLRVAREPERTRGRPRPPGIELEVPPGERWLRRRPNGECVCATGRRPPRPRPQVPFRRCRRAGSS
jgi:hypothetical protein